MTYSRALAKKIGWSSLPFVQESSISIWRLPPLQRGVASREMWVMVVLLDETTTFRSHLLSGNYFPLTGSLTRVSEACRT